MLDRSSFQRFKVAKQALSCQTAADKAFHAEKAAELSACVPPCHCHPDGILLAGRCTIPAADCALDQYIHPCADVLLLLPLLPWERAKLEATHHKRTDRAIRLQVCNKREVLINVCVQYRTCVVAQSEFQSYLEALPEASLYMASLFSFMAL